MRKQQTLLGIGVLILTMLAACGSPPPPATPTPAPSPTPEGPQPSREVSKGDILVLEDFDREDVWEIYQADNVDFSIENGVYRARDAARGYIWTLNETVHTNVIMEIQTEQFSTFNNNAYGLMCRAAPENNGNGYYFLIGGDGTFAILRGQENGFEPLLDWQTSGGVVNEGQSRNRIRAVCLDDYLAIYVNDEFLGDVTDTTYTSGVSGLAANAFSEEGEPVDVSFDNLMIWEAR